MTRNSLTPHDNFFKLSLKEKDVAQNFLYSHLEPAILAQLDFSKMELQDKSFINQKYQQFHSDLLYKIGLKNCAEDAYLYFLLEHQSSPDKLMAFRFLQYQILALEDYLKQNSKAEKLPVIIPLCVYHGQVSPYPYSTKTADCFNDPQLAELSLISFKLIDLTVLSEEDLATHGRASVFEMLLKTNKQRSQLINFIRNLANTELHSWLNSPHCKYFSVILEYIMQTKGQIDEQEEDELMDTLVTTFTEHAGETMTYVERWFQKGMMKGIEQGMQQGIQQGMQHGMQHGMQQGITLTIRVSKMLMRGASDQEIMQNCAISFQQLEIIKASLAELA